jgi:hypothetical protein
MRVVLDFIARHSQNAILASLIASVLALAGSVGSAVLTYQYTRASQDRQIRLDQLTRFDASSSQILEAAGAFISAINENKDLPVARQRLSAVLATQMHDADSIKLLYGSHVDRLINEYQAAVSELNQAAQKTSSVTEMRPWTESFGRVLDTKSNLIQGIYNEVGIQRRADI